MFTLGHVVDAWYVETRNFQKLREFLAVDEPGTNGWWDAHCPIHQDSKRSAGFNFDKGIWSCRAGCGSGEIDDLIDRLDAMEMADSNSSGFTGGFDEATVIELDSRRKRNSGSGRRKPAATDEEVTTWARALADDEGGALVRLVELRGIGPATLAAHQVGWNADMDAYTIPVRNVEGALVNVRLYAPNRVKTKIWNWEGMDPNCIYPEKILKENDTIVLCEGEWDALIANDRGFAAVTGTTGAMQWMPKWNSKFKGKDVVIVYDRDETGDLSSAKVARNLKGVARSVSIGELPMAWSNKHGLDVSDFFHKEGSTAEDFAAVIRNARVYSAPKDGDPVRVSVIESYNPSLSGTPMAMKVSVVGKGLQTHLVPKDVTFSCSINAGPKCHGCPMNDAQGNMQETVDSGASLVLALRDVATPKRDDLLREHFGIHKCGKMTVDIGSFQTTENLVVRTSIEEDTDEDDHRSRTIVNVGEYRTGTNSIVSVVGTTYPSPMGQESVFMAWNLSQVESSLDSFMLLPEDIETMKVFRRGTKRPLKKMGEIAKGLAEHVTHIYGRTALHVAMDLVFHSALSFRFAGDILERGWLELLCVGDARTGKSEIATKLSKHYRYGRIVSCESASIPGLLGAVKPMVGSGGKGWTLEWGAIPLNDRRLVVLDEVNGLPTEHIGQLSSLRSSGIAEIVKAEREITRARTRLIWLGNPRDNAHGMGAYMYGVQAIPPLIGSQEDIARFDMAMALGTGDVPSEDINSRKTSKAINPFTSEACHTLLSWAWSRTKDQIVWDTEAEDEVYRRAMEMGQEYVPDPPLVQMQNVRVKIARIAVAMAARTFSTDESCERIRVEKVHVEDAVRFLDHIYGMPSFGYKDVSERAKERSKIARASMDYARDYLLGRPYIARFFLSCGGSIRRQQIEEASNVSKEEGNAVIQIFTVKGLLQPRDEYTYKFTPELNAVLRDIRL